MEVTQSVHCRYSSLVPWETGGKLTLNTVQQELFLGRRNLQASTHNLRFWWYEHIVQYLPCLLLDPKGVVSILNFSGYFWQFH